jgi:hypothetical protein
MQLVVEREDLEVLESKSTDKVRMAGVGPPRDPDVSGAIVIFHDITTNTILIGEEGIFLFDDKDKKSDYYRYNLGAIVHPLKETIEMIDRSGNRTQIQLSKEQLTENIIPHILWFIQNHPPKTAVTPGVNMLFPIVAKNRDQPAIPVPNTSNYFSQPRIQPSRKNESCPKGGIKIGESALDCIKREIYEEIGDISSGVSPIQIQDADWIRDSSGKRYITGGMDPYAVFYKPVSPAQVNFLMNLIQTRRAKYIGEMFDFMFKRVPPAIGGRRGGINLQTYSGIEKLNEYLRSQGRPVFAGGAKKTRRSHRKRRTTSKRR